MYIFRKINTLYQKFLINFCLPLAFTNWQRVHLLKRIGVQMERPVHIYKGVKVRISKMGGVVLGKGVSIGPGVLLDGRRVLEIGQSTVIAYEAIIWTLNHDYNDIHFASKGAKVTIGPYAWICSRSIVLPGINIGEGAVVASGAVVTKDVPPYTVVAGIPARIIGQRERKKYDYGYKLKY